MNSAEEPLISRRPSPSRDHPDNDDSYDNPGAHEDTTPDQTSTSPTLFIYLLTLSAGISGLLFGCKPLPLPQTHHLTNPFSFPLPPQTTQA
jgi:SP family myo-inositol transporter-like MFS transporter 13